MNLKSSRSLSPAIPGSDPLEEPLDPSQTLVARPPRRSRSARRKATEMVGKLYAKGAILDSQMDSLQWHDHNFLEQDDTVQTLVSLPHASNIQTGSLIHETPLANHGDRGQIATIKNQIATMFDNYATTLLQNDQLRMEANEMEEEMVELRAAVESAQTEAEAAYGQIELLAEELDQARQHMAHLKDVMATLGKKLREESI